MRILMVAPHPVYSPRGTPISVINRCRALSSLGHEIDLVTFSVGQDVPVPGLRYARAGVPGVHHVGVGPSWQKILLDIAVFAKASWLLLTRRSAYDVLHTHEEAGLLGLLRGRRLPHVYDMGNDLSVVATNYGFRADHVVTRLARHAERAIVKSSDVVVAHFPAIEDAVRRSGSRVPVTVVPNVPIIPPASAKAAREFRDRWCSGDGPLVVYTGTLEVYQGVEQLVEAMASPAVRSTGARLLVVGGAAHQVAALRARAESLSLSSVTFAGALPEAEVQAALGAADVLVSPRATGSNTPLKLFSYLQSAKPILATRIASHTQVLDDESALLVGTGADSLAGGLAQLLKDCALRARLAGASARLAELYSPERYVAGVARAYGHLPGSCREQTQGLAATGERPGEELLTKAAGSTAGL